MQTMGAVRRELGSVTRAWWPLGAAVLVAVLGVGLAVAVEHPDRAEAQVGQVVFAGDYDVRNAGDLRTDTIRLPGAEFDVGVGSPMTDTSGDDLKNAGLDGYEVPDDGSFVAVSVEAQTGYRRSVVDPTQQISRVPVTVELVADGRRYVVPADPTQLSALRPAATRYAWVAVAGTPKTLAVAITFDGVRQTVTPGEGERDAGRAAALYAGGDDPILGGSCGTQTVTRGFVATRTGVDTCSATIGANVPYLAEYGWAPAGKTWFVVQARPATIPLFDLAADRDVSYYAFRDPTLTIALDAVTAEADADAPPTVRRDPGSDGRYIAVFAVDARPSSHDLTVSATYRKANLGDEPSAGTPLSPDITATWTRTVP